jgi:hypothetical protein
MLHQLHHIPTTPTCNGDRPITLPPKNSSFARVGRPQEKKNLSHLSALVRYRCWQLLPKQFIWSWCEGHIESFVLLFMNPNFLILNPKPYLLFYYPFESTAMVVAPWRSGCNVDDDDDEVVEGFH